MRWLPPIFVLVAGCGAANPPTVTGAEVYAQLPALQRDGHARVGSIDVRTEQFLITNAQMFLVSQVIETCHGGGPAVDVDCTLALVLDQRFRVVDRVPTPHELTVDEPDESASAARAVGVVAVGLGAIGGLTYGVATCEFAGCRAVFGLPLALVSGALLFALVAH